MEGAALALVSVDVLIDALMAHTRLTFQLETPRNLFRTPVAAEQTLDYSPRLRGDAWAVSGSVSGNGQLVRLLGPVAALPLVAAHFTRDGAPVAAYYLGDAGLVVSGSHQGVNLVSLLAGKLRVAHSVLL